MVTAAFAGRIAEAFGGKNRKKTSSLLKKKFRSLLVEGLENRQLMAANFSDSFTGYLGAGIDPTGTSGKLASNNYAVTMGSTVVAFGGSSTATGVTGGDRTNAPGNNVQTGLQAFSVGGISTGTDKMLGIQPTGSTFQSATNGNITLRVQNDGTAATTASIGYEVYVNNDQARSNSLLLSYSTDNVTYTPVPAATYTSSAALDASGLVLATTVIQSGIAVAVPANGFLYVRWTGVDVSGSGTRDEFGIDDVSIVLTGSPAAPEIDVQGNGVSIADNDTTPSTLDDTDFGSAVAGGGNIVRTFTIQNTGTGPLDLTGTPLVAISGSADFSVSAQPAADPVAAAGSTTFVVTFDPTSVGTQTATISIASDDATENPYNFDIQGIVNASAIPEINIQGNGVNIIDGDTTPDIADDTAFGSAVVGSAAITRTFTVQNTGTGALDLTGTPLVAISGSSDFTISTQPATDPIAAAGSTTFVVTFTPSTLGLQTASISIASDDSDENPYNFDVSGTAVAPTPIYINEIMFNPSGTDAPNEFVEIRGGANATIPAGTYLVAIEGDTTGAGDVQTIFNLGGLVLGSNGYLSIRQSGNSYAVDPAATSVVGTGAGFTGAAGFQSDAGTDIENASMTFLLILSGPAPTLTDDIDSDNNGTPDGAVYSGWTLLDQVAVLDNAADTSYAAITFAVSGAGTVPMGSVVVNTSTNTPNYIGRIGNSTGASAADWVGGGLTALTSPVAEWAFDRSQTFPSSLAGARIDDLGASNTFTASSVTIAETGTTDIAEGGATDTYTVVLNTQPIGNVTVTVTPDSQLNLGAGQGTAISLNFTNANWNTPQVVTVTAFDDVLVEGLHTGAITHTISTATLDYLGSVIAGVTANITDNDTVPVPEANVQGNGTTIVDGDVTPSVLDHSSFPATTIGNSNTRTYTIQNTGAGSLTLGAFSSTNGVFAIVGAPAGLIGPGASATFDVVFTPVALGSATATISFVNDDSDENPYNFDVDGSGVAAAAPEANVLGNTISITDGDVTPATADHTDFGVVRIGSTFTRTFTVENTGSANLTLGAFSSTNPLFTIPSPPAGPIAPAASVTFDVVFSPTAAGVQTSTISFGNNDGDENPYNFDVSGQGFELYINELMFNPSGTDAPNEYIEFRGTPGVTLPSGTYFIAIEGDTGTPNPGDVNSIFNLSGLTIGSNGYLVLLQGGNTYSVDDDATTVAGASTGWTGVAGFDADGTATDIENASASFFLVSTALTPAETDDIDTNDNGVADGTFFSSWSIIDQIAVLDNASDTSYASLSFAINGLGTVPGSGVVVNTGANTANYFGRIGDSTGSAAADWIGGGLTDPATPVAWAFHRAQTFPSSLAGARIDDLGATNSFTPSGVTITESGTTNVTEGGATDSYTVILNTQPIANVTVTVTPDAQVNLGAGGGTAISLVFTPVNWNVPQTVTVTAVDDAAVEGTHTGLIAHTITVGSFDYVGSTIASVTANITDNEDTTAPKVTGIFARNSNWTAPMIDAIDGSGTGAGNGIGYALTPLFILPNEGIDRIFIQFSEPVVGFNASNIRLFGVNTADYASTPGFLTVSYDSMLNRGEIQLATGSIINDKLRLGVSDSVTDVALNELDGDGNNTAGGHLDLRFNILVGDVSGDESVDGGDLFQWGSSFNLAPGDVGFEPLADWNSDESVDGGDLFAWGTNFNEALPGSEPGPLDFDPMFMLFASPFVSPAVLDSSSDPVEKGVSPSNEENYGSDQGEMTLLLEDFDTTPPIAQDEVDEFFSNYEEESSFVESPWEAFEDPWNSREA
jgi:Abnormal spindle-like microcephaly-assoc'd, ASPM-SPD-2-Hydin